MKALLLALVIAVASAQETPESIAAQVQTQQMVSGAYLQTILQFQRAQAQSAAASLFLQEASMKAGKNAGNGYAFLEEDDESDFEEEEEDHNPVETAKVRLQAAYQLFYSNQIRLYEILVSSPQIQQDYYVNRVVQMQVAAAGPQVPPALTQALYLNSFNTQLKTLRLAYSLQYVSHLRTWLEDEIDVSSTVAANGPNYRMVASEQDDDLLHDKQYAFQSYYLFALVDFQSFMLETYVQQILASLTTQTQTPLAAASLLEVDSSTETQWWSPLLFLMGGGAHLNTYTFYMTFYHRMVQLNAAQAGNTHVQLETQRLHPETLQGQTQQVESSKVGDYSDYSFNLWAQNLLQASQINYMLAIFNMYSLFAPVQAAAAQAQAQAQAK
jgi:hypothetical protein